MTTWVAEGIVVRKPDTPVVTEAPRRTPPPPAHTPPTPFRSHNAARTYALRARAEQSRLNSSFTPDAYRAFALSLNLDDQALSPRDTASRCYGRISRGGELSRATPPSHRVSDPEPASVFPLASSGSPAPQSTGP